MSRRVAVIGAGVIGLCSAYYLAREGHDVVVFERDAEVRHTTSFGNAGMVVPSHFVPLAAPGAMRQALRWMADPASPFYVKPRLSPELLAWAYRFWRAGTAERVRRAAPLLLELNLGSGRAYQELAAELGDDFGLQSRGLLMLSATAEGHEEEAALAAAGRRLGLEIDVLDPARLAELEPGIDLDVAGAVHYRGDAHLDPGRFMNALQASLRRLGVEFRWGSAVTAILHDGRRVSGIAGPDAQEAADAVVLAAGSWSAALARSVGVRLLLQPGKGYSMTAERPNQRLTTPAILTEARVAVTPLGERLRLGGTLELSGFDGGDGRRRVRGILDSAARYFPRLDLAPFEAAEKWHGYRPCSPDGLPYLGNARRCAGLTVATGHAMMGMSLAPVTGMLVADLVAGRRPAIDIAALEPERHAHRGAGRPRA